MMIEALLAAALTFQACDGVYETNDMPRVQSREIHQIQLEPMRLLLQFSTTTDSNRTSKIKIERTEKFWNLPHMQSKNGENGRILRYLYENICGENSTLSKISERQSISTLWWLYLRMLWGDRNIISDARPFEWAHGEGERSKIGEFIFDISENYQGEFYRRITSAMYELQLGSQNEQWRVSTQERDCSPYVITAYSVEMFPGTTADGTRTPGNAGVIAAGSYNLPFGTMVEIDGVGTYRIADRGHLGARHIDILTVSTREALNFGRQTRMVCIVSIP